MDWNLNGSFTISESKAKSRKIRHSYNIYFYCINSQSQEIITQINQLCSFKKEAFKKTKDKKSMMISGLGSVKNIGL